MTAKDNQGYVCFGMWHNNKPLNLYGHQYAWYVMYGECIPMIDHINRIKTDNRKINLRKADRQLNSLNRDSKGASFDKSSGKWMSQIMINGKNISLGRFKTESEAMTVYQTKKKEIINNLNN